MSKLSYLIRRLALAIFVVIGVLTITFIVSRLVPADPARLFTGPRASKEKIEETREKFGLNKPIPIQFVSYIKSTIQGDFGISFKTKTAILTDLKLFLPATLELVILSLLLAVVIGIPIGVYSGAQWGKKLDILGRVLTISGVSIPSFWLALILQLIFFSWLGWLPLGGRLSREFLIFEPIQHITGFNLIDAAITGHWDAWRDALIHIIMPAIVLAVYPICLISRMLRGAIIEVLTQDYVTAARASGMPEHSVLFRFALKNAIAPTLTVISLVFAYSISGSVLIEIVFNWPGLGKYITDAIINADFPVVLAVTLIVTVIYVLINLFVDLLQAAIDPRIQLH
jgi:peptide/nickel transport system permease protein